MKELIGKWLSVEVDGEMCVGVLIVNLLSRWKKTNFEGISKSGNRVFIKQEELNKFIFKVLDI